MRHYANLLTAGLGLTALGCTDRGSSPTGPQLNPPAFVTAGCDVSGARSLVNQLFPNSVKQIAQDALQAIQSAGAGTAAAADAGFDLLELVSTHGPEFPQIGSDLANAILPCIYVGFSPTIDFTAALDSSGAFAVRGSSPSDNAAVVSRGAPVWGMEPPLDSTWNDITVPLSTRLLVFGAPITLAEFTNEVPVGTIFDWFTIPTLTFNPGIVVGTCINDGTSSEYLIQHNAAGSGGEIVPSATPSFCTGGATPLGAAEGWSPAALAQRVFDFFSPRPLLATALGTRPPGGSIGSLSPSVAVNPGQITLVFGGQVADGRTKPATVKFTDGTSVSVRVTPAGSPPTPMDGVHVRLIATTNLGATVVAEGNTATTQDGIATFHDLTINKAGGYRLIATLDGFGQNGTAGFKFNNVTSNGFNLKQSR